jgi:hypothetical protein
MEIVSYTKQITDIHGFRNISRCLTIKVEFKTFLFNEIKHLNILRDTNRITDLYMTIKDDRLECTYTDLTTDEQIMELFILL